GTHCHAIPPRSYATRPNLDAASARACAMTRSVAVLHDINSHAVSFERELRRLVGNNFAVYAHGRFDLPASNVELARFVENRPDDVVFHALAAMPVYSSYGDTTFHSIIPI